MAKAKNVLFILVSCIIVLSFSACNKSKNQNDYPDLTDMGIPVDITEFLCNYFEECKNGPEAILKYRFFKNEMEKSLILENDLRIIDYKIEDAEKINDNLYAFKLNIQNNGMPKKLREANQYMVIYNFVINLNDTLYICVRTNDIPEELQENFNPDNYRTNSEVVGNIGGIDVVVPELVG